MKYVFLVNSFTLNERTEKITKRIEDVCKSMNLDYIIEVNSNVYSTEDILKKYKHKEYVIFAVGGDGIINRVLNSIVNTKNIMGIIPLGTGNDFYRTQKAVFKNGINEVNIIKINDKYFMNVACFGIDADIGNDSESLRSKFIPKSQRYNISVIKNFLGYKPKHFIVETKDEKIDGNFTTICVCNGKYYGGGYRINPIGILNDDKIEVVLAYKVSKIKLVKLITCIKKGTHLKQKEVRVIKTSNVKLIYDEEMIANVDGEELKSKEFEIKVYKNKFKMYFNYELVKKIID